MTGPARRWVKGFEVSMRDAVLTGASPQASQAASSTIQSLHNKLITDTHQLGMLARPSSECPSPSPLAAELFNQPSRLTVPRYSGVLGADMAQAVGGHARRH